jgi:hypothetical protein
MEVDGGDIFVSPKESMIKFFKVSAIFDKKGQQICIASQDLMRGSHPDSTSITYVQLTNPESFDMCFHPVGANCWNARIKICDGSLSISWEYPTYFTARAADFEERQYVDYCGKSRTTFLYRADYPTVVTYMPIFGKV